MFNDIHNEFFFTFRGIDPFTSDEVEIDSRFLKMALKEKPVEKLSQMKSDELDYDSLDGALYLDNNTFSNTEIDMEFYIKKDLEAETRQALTMLTLINSGTINFGWDEGFIRACRLNSSIELTEVDDDEYSYECTISFILAPYKYAVEGRNFVADQLGATDLSDNSQITNFYMTSHPYIYMNIYPKSMTGTDVQTFTITNLKMNNITGKYEEKSKQDITLYVTDTVRRVCIDCVNRFIYAVDENYGENLNYLLHMDCEFPILKGGINQINFCEGYKKANMGDFNIIPNWRTL